VNKNVNGQRKRKRNTKGKIATEYKWEGQGTKREEERGRATGGIITG
jgi:hypothetical protein